LLQVTLILPESNRHCSSPRLIICSNTFYELFCLDDFFFSCPSCLISNT